MEDKWRLEMEATRESNSCHFRVRAEPERILPRARRLLGNPSLELFLGSVLLGHLATGLEVSTLCVGPGVDFSLVLGGPLQNKHGVAKEVSKSSSRPSGRATRRKLGPLCMAQQFVTGIICEFSLIHH